MEIKQAQRDVRTTFLGGFAGQLISSVLWFLSAALATWASQAAGMAVLVLGGMLIFPLTQLTLRLMGQAGSLPSGHPMNGLGMQVAFTLPLTLPLVGAAAFYRLEWFYPAFMIALGAHYLPFIFLYGMWQFGVLTAVLWGGGFLLALYGPTHFSLGGWFTAGVLLIFALIGRQVVKGEMD
jgi:hypothetical protein